MLKMCLVGASGGVRKAGIILDRHPPGAEQKLIRLCGEIPSPLEIPSGCPFHTRCPRFLGDLCVQVKPPWRTVLENGKRYFCHIPVEDLRLIQASQADKGRSLAG